MTAPEMTPDAADQVGGNNARGRLISGLRIALGLLVLGAIVVAVQRNWDEVSTELGRLSPLAVVAAFLLALASPILTLFGWRALLADLGAVLSVPASASVFLVGQLGKYLPGSVWSVAIQSDMGGRLGVPRRTLGVAGLLSIVLAILTAAVVGVPAIPLFLRRTEGVSLLWVAVAVLALLVMVWPPVLNALIARGLRLIRRDPLPHPLSGRAIVRCVGWFVLAWLTMASAFWVLAADLAPRGSTRGLALAALSGYCLAAALGMLSFIVPAGVGVREALLVVLLLPFMPLGAATAVVVVHRFVTLLTDLVSALGAFSWARAHRLIGSSDD